MYKLAFSLLGAVTTAGGVFAGTLQQNLSHPPMSEIDRLFWEIEKDIRKFSNENPINGEKFKEVKCASSEEKLKDSCKGKVKELENQNKNTLGVLTTIWVSLINNYVRNLWMKYKENFVEKISENDKKEAIKKANDSNEKEINKFKEKLNEKRSRIDEIYEKMKMFVLKIEFPKNYQYNSNDYPYGPYENYVEEILKNNN